MFSFSLLQWWLLNGFCILEAFVWSVCGILCAIDTEFGRVSREHINNESVKCTYGGTYTRLIKSNRSSASKSRVIERKFPANIIISRVERKSTSIICH